MEIEKAAIVPLYKRGRKRPKNYRDSIHSDGCDILPRWKLQTQKTPVYTTFIHNACRSGCQLESEYKKTACKLRRSTDGFQPTKSYIGKYRPYFLFLFTLLKKSILFFALVPFSVIFNGIK
jgi:hypothetical protein